MSKCIKCGRELTSAEIPEFYNGMCEKCHREQNFDEYPFKQCIYDYQQQIDQLKHQLEEKDKEIERLKTKQELTFMHSKEDYFQRCNLLEEANIKLQFTQTQLAIQELEKVKMLIEWKFNSIIEVREYLQQQIKELKGEKDVED